MSAVFELIRARSAAFRPGGIARQIANLTALALVLANSFGTSLAFAAELAVKPTVIATQATAELRLQPARLITVAVTSGSGANGSGANAAAAVGAGGISASLPLATSATVAAPLRLASGKSNLLRVNYDVSRVAVGNPDNLDVILITAREIYFLGKRTGSTNVFLWSKDGSTTTIMEVAVSVDTMGLQEMLGRLMPDETGITVSAAGDSLVLSGVVSDAVKVQRVMALAEQFGGRRVLNLLSSAAPSQVMLEVKIAEVAKTVIDRLGARTDAAKINGGNFRFGLLTQLLSGAAGAVSVGRGANVVSIDAEIRNGLVKILAEPAIMAVSGQEGTFLAGGKIFIPVPQAGPAGATVTLEEKEYGVGVRFTPTVLEGGQINLRVTPEVSELSQIGVPFTSSGGATSVLPSITTRRASTTVQLSDGQSFVIGGLIKNNVAETIRRFPGLGDVPVLGALFRSSEFQNDASELLIIVTPRLVKPLAKLPALPTDRFIPPSRSDFLLHGKLQGDSSTSAPPAALEISPVKESAK